MPCDSVPEWRPSVKANNSSSGFFAGAASWGRSRSETRRLAYSQMSFTNSGWSRNVFLMLEARASSSCRWALARERSARSNAPASVMRGPPMLSKQKWLARGGLRARRSGWPEAASEHKWLWTTSRPQNKLCGTNPGPYHQASFNDDVCGRAVVGAKFASMLERLVACAPWARTAIGRLVG